MSLGLWPGALGAGLSEIVGEGSGRPLCDRHAGQEELSHHPPCSQPGVRTAPEQDEPGPRLGGASAFVVGSDVGELRTVHLLCETGVYCVASFTCQRKGGRGCVVLAAVLGTPWLNACPHSLPDTLLSSLAVRQDSGP